MYSDRRAQLIAVFDDTRAFYDEEPFFRVKAERIRPETKIQIQSVIEKV